MPEPIIEVQNLSKLYELGTIGGRTLRESLERRWYRMRGKEHLLHKIGAKHQMIGPDHPQAGPRPNTMWALKDVSFSVKEGEVLGIIGRNGAGKSTLLKLLTRITEPTSGRALMYGRVASLLEVGTGFHPELTGRENIYLSGAILGMKRAEIDLKFDEIVAFSEIGQYLDTPVKRYSSGMYVRLAFAVAAHLEPEILLVDEVLAVGDAEFQKKCLGKMGDVAKGGRTVLFVSHNMMAISTLCPQCAWIDSGRVERIDDTPRVIHDYLTDSQQGTASGEANLQDWPDRYGDGRARIASARLVSQDGSISTRFYRTKPLSVEFELNSFSDSLLTLSFVVVNDMGVNVLHLAHDDSPNPLVVSQKGSYRVRFTMPCLPLFPGSYSLTVGIHIGPQMIPVDVVKNVLPFEVDEPLDTPRPMKTPASTFLCWAPSTWSGEYLGSGDQ
jgi:lipopolysaccharide transport system ATP-binding protein